LVVLKFVFDSNLSDVATSVITDELRRMLDMYLWHSVHTSDPSLQQGCDIIPSRIFFMGKYLTSGAIKKFKTKLVAAGHQQDKGICKSLSSQTVAIAVNRPY
jgi:hypothetical protein